MMKYTSKIEALTADLKAARKAESALREAAAEALVENNAQRLKIGDLRAALGKARGEAQDEICKVSHNLKLQYSQMEHNFQELVKSVANGQAMQQSKYIIDCPVMTDKCKELLCKHIKVAPGAEKKACSPGCTGHITHPCEKCGQQW